MDPLLVIANASAGSAETKGVEAAVAVLREAADVEVCETSNPGELDGVLQRAGSRSIVVAGGDGSLHAVVSALHRRHELGERVLGLIPLGTGNDFARTLQLPLKPADAARALLAGSPQPMDLLVDELGEVVVNNVHLGASAHASRYGAVLKERLGRIHVGKVGLGLLGYPLGALRAAVNPPYVRLRVEVDGEVVADMDRHILMLAIGNGATVGGGTPVTPAADPQDGKVDVMLSYATGPWERLDFVRRLRGGDQVERDDVVCLRGVQVAVSGEDFWMSADGEILGPERRRAWHLEHGAYTLLLPAAP
ncbi:MAG: diacylglycerol/lipid kinase family protein [Marmoricola sp.]